MFGNPKLSSFVVHVSPLSINQSLDKTPCSPNSHDTSQKNSQPKATPAAIHSSEGYKEFHPYHLFTSALSSDPTRKPSHCQFTIRSVSHLKDPTGGFNEPIGLPSQERCKPPLLDNSSGEVWGGFSHSPVAQRPAKAHLHQGT